MSRVQRPANGGPIVRREYVIDIEAGIRQAAGNLLLVALGALEASARRFVTVVDIIVGNDFLQDRLVLLVVGIVSMVLPEWDSASYRGCT